MSQKKITNCSVGEAYLALLADRGVDYLFANAGTDFAPLIEAFAKAETLGTVGKSAPVPVTVPHENVAIAMAIGYAGMTGKPQAVMVHVNVGTANALCGLMNAFRGDIPVLFTAGRTPLTEKGLHGSRDIDIHWPQEMFDQAGVVREMVKWDYELRNAYQLETVVDRALNISLAEPQGPVYLTLPREVLSGTIPEFAYSSPSPRNPPRPNRPAEDVLEQAADIIAGAENPMIIATSSGRTVEAVAALGAVAERFAIPVVQYRPRNLCLPSNHPMHMGYLPEPLLEQADVVLVVDAMVPWLPDCSAPPENAKVIHLGPDPLFSKLPIWGFPCDLAIAGSVTASLSVLDDALSQREQGAATRINRRRKRFAAERAETAEKRKATIARVKDQSPIHPQWITHCLNEIKGEDSVIVRESPLLPEYMDLNQPYSIFKAAAAAGLGVGLGVGLGIKLADRDRLVIVTEGDGSYMFATPVAAHYVSHAEKLPLLTVIYNNQRWNAVHGATLRLNPGGYAEKSNREPLTHLETGSRFEKAVEIYGGHGAQVTDPRDLPKALDKALDVVQDEGRQALVNVVCSAK